MLAGFQNLPGADPVTEYAEDVIAGRIVAGPHVRAACKRHMRDRQRDDIYFDYAAMRHVFGFFENHLRLAGGQFENKPFVLHPAQKFKLGSIFGWMLPDGTRRYRRAYIEEGKGNGKSPFAGGIGLYGMLADDEPGAEIYAAGATRAQGDILFQDAVKMARAVPSIDEEITYSGNAKVWNIAALGPPYSGAFFRPIARTAGQSGSGPRPHMALADELHEHPSRDVIEMLERGFKFRRQPLLLMITNSGSDRNSVCWEEHEHAIGVARGDIDDDSTFSYVCALDDGDDPFEDPSCWTKANPLLGTILTHDYLAKIVKLAKQIPGKENSVRRLHFCQWTDAETAWLPREAWEACEDPKMKLEDFEDQPCRAGLDLSSRKDLTATALVFNDGHIEKNGEMLPKFALFAHGYTPKATLDARVKTDRAPYDVWVKQKYLTATPGPVVRFSHVIADLADYQQRFQLEAVAYDRHLITRFEEVAEEMGVDLPLVEHPQGYSKRKGDPEQNKVELDNPLWMPESVETFETLVLEKRIRIQVNPALRSAVASACFDESPAGLKRFAKQRAVKRIDMCVAAAMAIGVSTTEAKSGISVYELMARQSGVPLVTQRENRAIDIDDYDGDDF